MGCNIENSGSNSSSSSSRRRVHYCCVSKGNQILCASSGNGSGNERGREGEMDVENLATLCLENTPPFHAWYFETFGKRTFGFLALDIYTYFAIADEGLGNLGSLRFLQQVRDQFNKLIISIPIPRHPACLNSNYLQERFVPILRTLINSSPGHPSLSSSSYASLSSSSSCSSAFHVGNWSAASEQAALSLSPSPSNMNGQNEVTSSTKAPLLGMGVGRSSMHEKKKNKDHNMVELEEHRRSGDGVDSSGLGSAIISSGRPSAAAHRDLGSIRNRQGSQSMRRKWWHQVRIVLAIDAIVCVGLFLIWLFICLRTECLR